MTSDKRPVQRPGTAARPEEATQLSQSLSNEEFIATYRALDSIQKKLTHEEFHFVRYLLKMALLELDSHSKPDKGSDNENDTDDSGGPRLEDAC